jgi:DNA-binding NtrC family response regulator
LRNEVRIVKILLVDDDPELAEVLAMRLTRRGFEVSQALSVDEARATFDAREGAFSAVLCDYHIGLDTGLAVYDHVSDKAFAGPFVLMSGAEVGDVRFERLCSEGKCHRLLKPFQLESLLSLIKK